MRGNRRRDTAPETRLRATLHRRGLRYFVDRRPIRDLAVRADLVFPRARVAVFVDGCFWHGCPDHFRTPRTNVDYWAGKIAANRARDERTASAIEARGWRVLRLWEHDDPEACAALVEEAVRTRAIAPAGDARAVEIAGSRS